MVNPESASVIERWFAAYVCTFALDDKKRQSVIEKKVEHCRQVREEITGIAASVGLDGGEVRLAQVVGLCHDVGRFEQVARYGTLADAASENHARLGVRILERERVLGNVDRQVRKVILTAIESHNKPELPARLRGQPLLHARLIRDADKLDIYRILTALYERRDGPVEEGDAVFLEMPDDSEISDGVYRELLEGSVVRYGELRTLNDFKLLQMAWVYDIHFPLTFQRIQRCRYLEKIRCSMAPSKKVDRVYEKVRSYLEERCS